VRVVEIPEQASVTMLGQRRHPAFTDVRFELVLTVAAHRVHFVNEQHGAGR